VKHALPDWALHPDLVAYYEDHRDSPEDLYPSEARFLPWLARSAQSVLDVGCAAGGFRTIWQHYAREVRYEGVDLSPALVVAARRLHPDSEFHHGDVLEGIDLPDRHADVVQALGWLHWIPEQERAIGELWRLARRFLFFDIRIVADPAAAGIGRQRIALVGEWDGKTETPYVTVAWSELARTLAALGPSAVFGYGYWAHPSDTARDVPHDVCMATFVLVRGRSVEPRICLDLPLQWPVDAAPGAEILPPERLAEHVPSATIGR
jgi:SAM-dependent methyltransferase